MEDEVIINNEEKKKDYKVMFKWLAIILLVAVNFIIIFIKSSSENFKWGWFIVIEVLLIIFSATLFLIYEIPVWFKNHFKESEEHRLRITFGDAQKLADYMMADDRFLNEKKEVIDEGTVDYSNQTIYFIHCKGRYPNSDGSSVRFFVAINMHYPESKKRILVNPTDNKMNMALRRLVKGKLEELPDEETTVSENLLTGTKITSKKTKNTHADKKKKKESDI